VVLGIRRDGQKVPLAVKNMGGESEAAWRTLLDDRQARFEEAGARHRRRRTRPREGAAGAAVGAADPTLHRAQAPQPHRHAPKKLAEEIAADYSDMIYANTAKEVETRRKAFLRKWRLKCQGVATSRGGGR
jgi:hypothetical protein